MLQPRTQVGKLDREIIFIEKVTEVGEANGQELVSWREIENYPCVSSSKEDMPGKEVFDADRLAYSQLTKFVIRYRDDINAEMRIVYETKVYNIVSPPQEEGRKRFMIITANLIDNEFFT
jgi:SPP1 family predicted phage head-tail adaptor